MLNCFPSLDDGGRGHTFVYHRHGNQVVLGRTELAEAAPADALEAAAHIFNSRNAGIDDATTVKFLRDHAKLTFPCPGGCSEEVIAAGFAQADAASLATIWQATPDPKQLELAMARIENDARSGKTFREILTRMRAEGLAARAARRPSQFGGESTIAEAFRRVQLKHAQVEVDDGRGGGGSPPAKGGSGVVTASLVVIGLAAAAGGVIWWRRRQARALPTRRRGRSFAGARR